MGVCDNILAGKYENKMSRDFSGMTPEAKKAAYYAYHNESKRLHQLFYTDVCESLGLSPEKRSSEKLFQYACNQSNGSSLYDVYLTICGVDELITEIIELNQQGD